MLQVQTFTFSPLAENTYVLYNEFRECLIIDPGCYNASEEQELKYFIEKEGLAPKMLLNTHGHIDHIFGNAFVKNTWDIPYYMCLLDLPLFERAEAMAMLWNLHYNPSPEPDHDLIHGQVLKMENDELEVRFVPGHAPGHMVFVNHAQRWVIGGDTLFRGSIGRTDLPGGNHAQLLDAIRHQLFSLPEDYTVYSGHGPETSIGYEKETNPFF
ncbi:MAG: MBL fold metallo-hydrolase [Bacteroidetes bacterium]|nr:MBL fold metallo-hydrolase [Bacteroidota bacterium]